MCRGKSYLFGGKSYFFGSKNLVSTLQELYAHSVYPHSGQLVTSPVDVQPVRHHYKSLINFCTNCAAPVSNCRKAKKNFTVHLSFVNEKENQRAKDL